MNRIIFVLYILANSNSVHSQDNSTATSKTHTVSFKTQFIQIEDEFNYGLVYSGPNLVASYSYSKITNKDMLMYSPEIAFGGVF